MGDRRGQYPRELRERAVRLVLESRDQYESEWAAMTSIAGKLGIGTTETLRKWVRQAEVDDGARAGTRTEESAELKRLKREVAELRRANEIPRQRRVSSRQCQHRDWLGGVRSFLRCPACVLVACPAMCGPAELPEPGSGMA